MPIPSTKKEMRRHMGRLTALGWFITWFTNKLHIFLTTLYRSQTFGWIEVCKSVFDDIKRYLIEPHILNSIEVKGMANMAQAIN